MNNAAETYKLRCKMVKDLTNTMGSEILYLANLLKEKENIEVREYAFNMLNSYLGVYLSPQGVCNQIIEEARSEPALRKIIDCQKCELITKYFEISEKYRETHER